MSVFFDIPKVHQIDILARWLQPINVALLDSATTTHKYRTELLDVLRSPECTLGCLNFSHERTMSWVVARQVKLAKISVCSKYLGDGAMREQLLQTIGPTLKFLDLNCKAKVIATHSDSDSDEWNSDENEDEDEAEDSVVPIEQLIYDFSQHCHGLATLKLSDGILDGVLTMLINVNRSSLTKINLSRCGELSCNIMKSICCAPKLKKLRIDACSFATNALAFYSADNTSCTTLVTPKLYYTNSTQMQKLTSKFPNLRCLVMYLHKCEDLMVITAQCRFVEYAQIELFSQMTVEHATTIAENWRQIKQVQLWMDEGKSHLCGEDAMLVLISHCLTLQRLTLARRGENKPFLANNNIDPHSSVSHLQELTVSTLSKNALISTLDKCPLLHTLCIHLDNHHASSAEEEPAERHLHLLNHTSIKTLCLTNCDHLRNEDLICLRSIRKLVLRRTGAVGSTLNVAVLQLLNAAVHVNDIAFTVSSEGNPKTLTPSLHMLNEVVRKFYPHLQSFRVLC
eukprot:gene20181-22934_t